jgi:hypothetical protein
LTYGGIKKEIIATTFTIFTFKKRKLHFGEDIPTEKPRLARTTFPDTFEV